MSGNGQTKTLTLSDLRMTGFDLGVDTIAGTGTPSAQIQVCANIPNRCISRWLMADGDGNWTANFGVPGTGNDDPDTFDVQQGSNGWAAEYDADSDRTWFDWWVPNPRMTVFPEWEWFDGYDWPDGATVNITVTGKSECTTSKVSLGYFFNGSFGEGCDLMIGDEVTFSDGTTIRMHTVENLTILAVSVEANTVAGTAAPGTSVHVWPHGYTESMPNADGDGYWLADFDGLGIDLTPGMSGRSEVRDAVGNATAVDWYISNPRIVAQITDDWFRAEDFTSNGQLTFWIYDGVGGPLLRHPENTWQLDSSGFVTVGMWELQEYWDLVPGNYLVVSDGTVTKELVLEAFTFDIFDTTIGHLQGTAPEPYGRTVWVGIGLENDAWTMNVTTDLNGDWSADFGAPVPSNYQWVAAQIFDADGDASELRPASQIVFLRPRCGTDYTVQPNIPLEIRYGSWLALGEDLAAQNAEHLTVDFVLDGQPIIGVQQLVMPGSEIPCGALMGAYGVFYIAQVGPLSAGTHTALVTWILDEQVTDGYDTDGDGVPDVYGPGVVFTAEFTILVQ
jgi:hypothetical protein